MGPVAAALLVFVVLSLVALALSLDWEDHP